jgi:hypothetical protein
VLTNLVIICQAPALYTSLPFAVQGLVTNAFIFVLPGLWALSGFPRLRRQFIPGQREPRFTPPAMLVGYLWSSLLMLVGVASGRKLLSLVGIVHTGFGAWSFWAACGLAIEMMMLLSLARKRQPALPGGVSGRRGMIMAAAVAAAAYGLASWGATRVVPLQQDQDMVLICPTYGLYNDLLPYGLETRMPYQFNKPLALYFFTGASIILRGEIEFTRPFYTSGVAAVHAMEKAHRFPKGMIHDLREKDIKRFLDTPRLTTSVRVVASGIAALLACTTFLLLVDCATPKWAAVMITAGMLALPEVFIRLACMDFTSISLLLLTIMLWLYLGGSKTKSRDSSALFWCSALLALTNHKALLVVPAYLLADLLAVSENGARPSWWAAWGRTAWRTGVLPGAVAGSLAYWIYGFAVDAEVFLADHVYRDFLYRLSGRIDSTYPSLGGVWLQWLRNTSLVTIPLGVTALAVLAVKGKRHLSVMALWFAIGAVLASATDWKQTKHLMLSLPPLVLAPGLAWPFIGRTLRCAVVLLLGLALCVSGYTLYRLSLDFSFLPPSKVW